MVRQTSRAAARGPRQPGSHRRYSHYLENTNFLSTWSSILKTIGIKHIEGDIVADISIFDNNPIPKGWCAHAPAEQRWLCRRAPGEIAQGDLHIVAEELEEPARRQVFAEGQQVVLVIAAVAGAEDDDGVVVDVSVQVTKLRDRKSVV